MKAAQIAPGLLQDAVEEGYQLHAEEIADASNPPHHGAEVVTAHDTFHQPPTWQIQVHLSTTGVIRSAKVYHDGKGTKERHFASDTTTLEEVLFWANQVSDNGFLMTAKNLLLV